MANHVHGAPSKPLFSLGLTGSKVEERLSVKKHSF